jgi:hypothetical protein
VQQELIVEIHRTAIWHVVVTVDGNISKTTKIDFIDRDGIYIILMPDWNLKSFKNEIKGLVEDQKHSFTRLWNSESRFVLAGAKQFSMTQQTDIFDYLSKLRIYNFIIISQHHYVTDPAYIRQMKENNVDTVIKLAA